MGSRCGRGGIHRGQAQDELGHGERAHNEFRDGEAATGELEEKFLSKEEKEILALPVPSFPSPSSILLQQWRHLSFPQLLQLQALLITNPPISPNPNPNLLYLRLISAPSTPPSHSILLFSSLPFPPNPTLTNSFLKLLSTHPHLSSLSLLHFNSLPRSPFFPDEFTFTSILKSSAAILSVPYAESAHSLALKLGHLRNVFVANSLVDAYFKLSRPDSALKAFDEMPLRDVVSRNTLISGHAGCGDVVAARDVFDGMAGRTPVSWSAMIAGYARSHDLAAARELFDSVPAGYRNVVCWNAMISGYAQNEHFSEAVKLFRIMLGSGVQPNEVTLVSVLSACANLGALDLGKWIDGYVKRRRIMLGLFLGNALSDMYAKCGCIGEAKKVFCRMVDKDVISWTVIISASAMHGLSEEAISSFRDMLRHGTKPNDITFMAILSACTHAGLVDDGLNYFEMMSREFGIDPKVEHYGCVVDLLSRAGRLGEAEDMISSMRVPPNVVVWGALLGGCRIYKDVARGERVVQRILELDPEHSGSYVYLSTLYASLGRLEDAARCRLRMRANRVVKTPGCSWIEVDNAVHEFFVGDRSHPQSDRIYSMISSLGPKMKLAGYVPNTSVVTQFIDEEEKEDALFMHSEKLAVAFGLISTKEGTTIRVVKNLRVCNDCHDAMKIISKIVEREIVLRDRNRFHHFKEGRCSCNDYW